MLRKQINLRIESDILVIEDSRSVAMILVRMLSTRWGCRVVLATSMEQAKHIISASRTPFFLAISDLNLPDSPNGEIIDLLIQAHIPVIAVTGTFDPDMIQSFMSKGCIDYVIKKSINDYEYIVELVGRLYRNSKLKVMVIDDSKSFRLVTSNLLRKQLLEVHEAHSADEAFAILQKNPDMTLVIVDYIMDQLSGIDFLVSVRKLFNKNQLCVIGMSGADATSLSSKFLKLGANDFLVKPFSYEELTCRVSHNLEMMESIRYLRYIADHDFLTGLYNRRAFFEKMGKVLADAVKQQNQLLSAMIDIDFFKKINDAYGHEGGDTALKYLAQQLKTHFQGELVARLGGEEFALIVPVDDNTLQHFEDFRRQIETTPCSINGTDVFMTISIGLALHTGSGLDDALNRADNNLYEAKRTGRNRIVQQ